MNVVMYPTHDQQNSHQIQNRVDPSYASKDMLMDTIEELPRGVEWTYRPITLHGDLSNDSGNPRKEELELWFHDPIEVVRELMGNPTFHDAMQYAPVHVYQDLEQTEEVLMRCRQLNGGGRCR